MSYCPSCGNQVASNANFCVHCGSQLRPAATHPEPAVKNMAYAGAGKKKSRLQEIQDRYPYQLITLFVLMVVGIFLFTKANTGVARIEKPVQYEVVENGCYLSTTKSLSRFDRNGNLLWKIDRIKGRPISEVLSFDIDRQGKIYLAVPDKGTIELISKNGEWIDSIARVGSVITFEILDDGNIVAASTNINKIFEFTRDGKLINEVGRSGSDDGEFHLPNGISQLPDGSILVSDTDNLRLQEFNRELNHKKSWYFSQYIANRVGPKDAPTGLNYKELDKKLTGNIRRTSVRMLTRTMLRRGRHTPIRILVDPQRERVYVSFLLEYKGFSDGHIAVFDLEGNFIDNAILKTQSGKRLDPFSMRLTPDGGVAVVDIQSLMVGEWNPDTNTVSPPLNPGVKKALSELASVNSRNIFLYWLGMGFFATSILGVIVLVIIGSKSSTPDL